MTLDDSLRQLQGLEVGNVERVIGEIEEIKIGAIRTGEEMDSQIGTYTNLVLEKLPRTIDNIQIIGNQISELRGECQLFCDEIYRASSFTIVEIGDLELSLRLRRGNLVSHNYFDAARQKPTLKKHLCSSTTILEEFKNSDDRLMAGIYLVYDLNINFDEEYGLIKKINFPKPNWLWRNLNYFSAENSEEFSRKYLEFILPEIARSGNSEFSELPFVLNFVPNAISRMYEIRNKSHKDALIKLKENNSLVNQIDTSDFK